MKKIYTLFLTAITALGANAQIVVMNDGVVCKAGETITIKAEETAYDFDEDGTIDFVLVECGLKQPVLKNEGSTTNVKVTVKSADYKNLQCCFPGNCSVMSKDTEVYESRIEANSEKPLQLESSFSNGYATYEAQFTVEANGKSDTYTLRLVYDESCTAGISEITTDNSSNKAIYDISGRRVNHINSGQIYIRDGKKFIAR